VDLAASHIQAECCVFYQREPSGNSPTNSSAKSKDFWTLWRWAEPDANRSLAKFPANRANTGRLASLSQRSGGECIHLAELKAFTSPSAQFKRQTERGIITLVSGNLNSLAAEIPLTTAGGVSVHGIQRVSRWFEQACLVGAMRRGATWSRFASSSLRERLRRHPRHSLCERPCSLFRIFSLSLI
jgi:hypothetical protein